MSTRARLTNRRYYRYFVDLRILYQRKEIVVYTSLILSLFTIAFFGLFALRPTLVTIAGLVREIEDKKVVNQKLESKINDLRQAQLNYGQVAGFVPQVEQAFPQDAALSDLVYQIEILAQKRNVTLGSLNFNPTDMVGVNPKQKPGKTDSGFSEITFDLIVKGDYASVRSFLGSLENLRRLIIVDSFSMTKTQTEERITINLALTGRAFLLPEKQ